VERDCGVTDVSYQVDLDAERLRAFGVDVFPTVLMIVDGVVGPAHIVITRAHLRSVLERQNGRRAPAVVAGESKEG
jgi:hypothetical protein